MPQDADLPRYNIAPGQSVPVLRQVGDGLELVSLRWGLIPFWAKDEKIKYRTINARAETVAEKPAYRSSFRRRRCLVPATGFYEWQGAEGRKVPWFFHVKSRPIFAFAGLWDSWEREDSRIQTFTIIVTDASGPLRRIHDRMPVILPPEAYQTWLAPEGQDPAVLHELLRPWAGGDLEGWMVDRRVNSPRNEGADLVRPAHG